MSRSRRPLPLFVVVALTAAGAGCSSSAPIASHNAATTQTTATPTESTNLRGPATSDSAAPSTAVAPDEVSTLAAVGLGVYADAATNSPIVPVTSEVPSSPMRLLATQARAMQLEAADGQGLLGAYIDQVIGADPGMPPPSYMIAGWATGSQSPGAQYAHTLMGDRDW